MDWNKDGDAVCCRRVGQMSCTHMSGTGTIGTTSCRIPGSFDSVRDAFCMNTLCRYNDACDGVLSGGRGGVPWITLPAPAAHSLTLALHALARLQGSSFHVRINEIKQRNSCAHCRIWFHRLAVLLVSRRSRCRPHPLHLFSPAGRGRIRRGTKLVWVIRSCAII